MRVDRVEFQDALLATDQRSSWGHYEVLDGWRNTSSLEEREEIILEAWATPGGWTALSQAMIEPISFSLEYTSRLRSILIRKESESLEHHLKDCLSENRLVLEMGFGEPHLKENIDVSMFSRPTWMRCLTRKKIDECAWISTTGVQVRMTDDLRHYENDILTDLVSIIPNTIIDSIEEGGRLIEETGGVILCRNRSEGMLVCSELGIDLIDDDCDLYDGLLAHSKDIWVFRSCVPGIVFLPPPEKIGVLSDCGGPRIHISSEAHDSSIQYIINIKHGPIVSVEKDAHIWRLFA